MKLIRKKAPHHMTLSMFSGRLSVYRDELIRIAGDTFVMVEPSLENVNKTIESFDSAVYGDFRNRFFDYGKRFFESEYGHIFEDCIMHSEELSETIDWTKSAGYTATYHHIPTKGALIKDEKYLCSDHWRDPIKTVPITTVANKKELKSKEDVLANKIRLFFISEFHLCYAQLMFGKKSSLRLKNLHWSAYGWSPFQGGVQTLARELMKKPIRFFYDVSGWDKFVPIMRDLFEIIKRKSCIPPHLTAYFDWMVQHTCAFVCALYDGDVVLKDYGNCSGSGTTTRDNTLMHVILAASFLSEAFFTKNGYLPSFDLLSQQVVRLFGDDSLFAVDIEFDYVLHMKDSDQGFLNVFFKRLGMKLKFLYGGEDFPINKMEFLGFRFQEVDGDYCPYYNPVRLATSMVHTNDKKDNLDAYISKCFVLTIMSFATEHCETFLEAYKQLISSIRPAECTPCVRAFLSIGALNRGTLQAFYTGRESCLVDLPFFESAMVVGGIREQLLYPHLDDVN